MRKIHLSIISVFVMFFTVAQTQQPNSITPDGKRSWAETDSTGVSTFAEQNPEFPGGDGELVKCINKNLRYPQMERDNHIEGKVLVRFVIDEEGIIKDAKIIQKVSPGLDREAIRVVKSLPRFIPGKQQGKPVKVYFNLPVVFKL